MGAESSYTSNNVGAGLRPSPDARVIAWTDVQAIDTLYLSAIIVMELRFGAAACLPAGAGTGCACVVKGKSLSAPSCPSNF
ncbi:hypothetical protein [Chelativorans sp. AA-79]|uniref:hypothetical protein n=1 Tax=Chelativorans sp. AA-79 TaxID=3028735 RepID=UPI0023F64170|nr:hypothetical protein [Chelativorans sp. AA-79]WEX07392.1 hypothetical protein PVE73_14810 [Chelativorans sp. AA-79]